MTLQPTTLPRALPPLTPLLRAPLTTAMRTSAHLLRVPRRSRVPGSRGQDEALSWRGDWACARVSCVVRSSGPGTTL